MPRLVRYHLQASTALLLVFGAACERRGVEVYTVAKEVVAAPARDPAVTLPATVPDHWQAVDPAGGPRVASFRIGSHEAGGEPADMGVTVFPGAVGGLLANVNRWRGEMGEAKVSQEELHDVLGGIEIDGHQIHIVDAASAERRTLGAILPLSSETYFFKLTGPLATVTANESAFTDYLSAVKIGAGAVGAPPPGETAPPPERPQITYQKPEPWIKGEANNPRVASFSVAGSEGREADIAVIPLGNAAGGGLANVNMWRATLQLDAATQEQLPDLIEEIEVGDTRFQLVDFESENALLDRDRKARIVVAFGTVGEHTWYFKLRGESSLVAEQKPVLLEFLRSVEFEN